MTKRKIKRFRDHSFQLELTEKKKQLDAYLEMLKKIKELDADAHNLEELNTALNQKTGFSNSRLSAMAYNKENDYDLIVELDKKSKGITPEDVEGTKLSKEAVNRIKEKHTIYFDDAELEAKKVLDKVMDSYNRLPMEYRRLIGFNYKMELMYSPLANRM